ncbi:alpha/beta fold hydrolase [Gordonia sp. ABSL11-1]|uniref:alpha/beta fold hydrolase n=1 Tax=Gordonia sp. ABSL11-1 TaxID=3053924 RepID=UPI0025742E28|nr:alpha/beta fold hydrolase [Gordonia sp. ABSL11-1]MDL9946579.1 alpha/beta fold hydrolase [Gordonia sp. ABSL11-1]
MTQHHQHSGRTLVLVHGTPLSPSVWDETVGYLGDRTIHTPDCSRVPDSPAAQAKLAETVMAEVVGEVDVVGHSFGGQIAIEMALLAPERVRSLMLLCTRDTPFPPFAPLAEQVRDGHAPAVDASLERWFTKAEISAGGSAITSAREQISSADSIRWAAALAAIAAYDSSELTPLLRMPVTVVAAGRDHVSTPDAMGDMARRIPGAQFVVRPDWAHMSGFTVPDVLAGIIDRATDSGADALTSR